MFFLGDSIKGACCFLEQETLHLLVIELIGSMNRFESDLHKAEFKLK